MARLSGPLILMTESAPPAGVAGAQIVSLFLYHFEIIVTSAKLTKFGRKL